MKKSSALLIFLLVLSGILIYEVVLNRNLKNKYARYKKDIHYNADRASDDLLRVYRNFIIRLENFCKSDTIDPEIRNDYLRHTVRDLANDEISRQLFSLLRNLYYDRTNRDKVQRDKVRIIEDEYLNQSMRLTHFLIGQHGKDYYDYSIITNDSVDTLIAYIKKLAACVEKLQTLKAGP